MQKVQLLGMKMANLTTMGVKLNEDVRTRLKNLGESRDRTPHWLMKKAISEFLDREETLEIRNREADKAFDEYLATGQSVSHEVMDLWLKSWGTELEGKCPKLKN